MRTFTLDFPITVLGREMKITSEIRHDAMTHIRRTHQDSPKIVDAKVTCWKDHHEVNVSINAHCAGGIRRSAEARSETVEAAIDLAFNKLERQSRKSNTRRLISRQK